MRVDGQCQTDVHLDRLDSETAMHVRRLREEAWYSECMREIQRALLGSNVTNVSSPQFIISLTLAVSRLLLR